VLSRESGADIGTQIGAYQIIRQIGAGGMGVVYLAERVDQFRMQVALKILRRGMDSDLVVSRFRHERQILAELDHPNIARLLDGGATDDGRPYFVMEYVQGMPLTGWCEQHGLQAAERLKLFRDVCAAVQYAHQNLVIHRDLKPANILVTSEGVPKLLDFGIAKLLRHEPGEATTGVTVPGMRMMTPEYASPEQVRGLSATTQSDVYSLGVVLYELLAGVRPYQFDAGSYLEIEKAVCLSEPPPPSTRAAENRKVAADLDNIALKALEKDPRRRYATAEQFSEDIRRYLDGRPVSARPQTWTYRAQKFAQRNRAAVAAAALVVFSLVGGLGMALWQARVASVERARAERRFHDVRRLANSFLFEFHDKIKDLTGSTEARRLIVARALEYLDGLAREAGSDTGLALELAEGYVRLGDVQGSPYQSNLGEVPGALASYDKAATAAETALRNDPRNPAAIRALAKAQQARGGVLPLVGREGDGIAATRKAVEGIQRIVDAYPKNVEYRVDLSRSLEALGDALLAGNVDSAGGAEAYRRSLDVWNAVVALEPGSRRAARATAVLTMKLGDLELNMERLEAAKPYYERALERMGGADRGNPENLRVVAILQRRLAYITSSSDPVRGLEQYRSAAAGFEELSAADPRNSRARMDFAVVLKEAGELEQSLPSERGRAMDSFRRVAQQLETVLAADPNNTMCREYLAEMNLRMGLLLVEAGRAAEARQLSARGVAAARALAERQGATPRHLIFAAEALVRAEPPDLRDPAAAVRYARAASDAVGGRNALYLDIAAQALFQAGDGKGAIETGEKALALLPAESALRGQLERHIKEFRAKALQGAR
jgi:eukaryotic-like serine/threonine-protein kinase